MCMYIHTYKYVCTHYLCIYTCLSLSLPPSPSRSVRTTFKIQHIHLKLLGQFHLPIVKSDHIQWIRAHDTKRC